MFNWKFWRKPCQFVEPTEANFLAFARTKRGSYNYMDSANCPFAQFLREACGITNPFVSGYDWEDLNNRGEWFPIPARVGNALPCTRTWEKLVKLLKAR